MPAGQFVEVKEPGRSTRRADLERTAVGNGFVLDDADASDRRHHTLRASNAAFLHVLPQNLRTHCPFDVSREAAVRRRQTYAGIRIVPWPPPQFDHSTQVQGCVREAGVSFR